jgi:hypothetical protein
MPPSPAAVVTIARRLEIAAHAEVECAVRRVREEGQNWAEIATILGLNALAARTGSGLIQQSPCGANSGSHL